jgi:putative transposase
MPRPGDFATRQRGRVANAPKRRFAAIAVMVAEGLPAQLACRVLEVSESGFYAWRIRAPSLRALRHARLTEVISRIHVDFRGVYGYRRVHAEPTLGHGITVGAEALWLLMRKAGLQGISGRPRYRRIPNNQPTASDLVERDFARDQPDRLWVTDITEHPTREGKVYCAAVLDVFPRRIVGWSIDSTPTAALVTNALSMAIGQRTPTDGTVIHSDQGTQGGLNWSSQHLDRGGVRGNDAGAAASRPVVSGAGAVAWAADGGLAKGSGPVLGGDRSGGEDRGRGCGRGRVIAGGVPVVPPRWRREPLSGPERVGPLSLIRRA